MSAVGRPGNRYPTGPPRTAGDEPAVSARVPPGPPRAAQRAEIPLTRIEYDLLLFLAEHPRRVFTRRQLLTSVWGYEHAVARTADVHVRRLRATFGPDTPLVTTGYGVGYRLADDAAIVLDHDA